jgi:hypothetical protein
MLLAGRKVQLSKQVFACQGFDLRLRFRVIAGEIVKQTGSIIDDFTASASEKLVTAMMLGYIKT